MTHMKPLPPVTMMFLMSVDGSNLVISSNACLSILSFTLEGDSMVGWSDRNATRTAETRVRNEKTVNGYIKDRSVDQPANLLS